MKNRFVLLTSQNNVYDIAYNSLDWRKGRLYLSGARTRQNIYPELTKKIDDGTGFFSGTHKRLVVIDEYSQYLYVESNDMNVANTYDIVHSKTMYYKVKDNVQPDSKEHHVALSSNEALAFYLLEFKNDDDKSGLIQKVSFYGGHRLTDSSNLKPTSNKYYLCYSQTAADKIYMSTDSCKHRLSWNVIQGFVDTYNFYLFSSNQTVLIFSTSAFSTPGTQVKLNLIRYDDFFVCNSAPTLTTSGKYALLVIGIIIVCAVLGTVIFFLIFSGFQNNDQPQQQQDNLDNSNIMQQSQQPQMIQPKTSNAGIMVVIPSGGGDPNVQLQQQIALQQMALQSNMQPIQSSVTPWKRSKTKRNSQCSRTGSNKRNSAKSSRGSKITSKQSRKQSSRKRSSKRKQSKRASKKQDD